jgi:hypothetical protein
MSKETNLTPLCKELHRLAISAGLENPLGRAIALTNRFYNDKVISHMWEENKPCPCLSGLGGYLICTCPNKEKQVIDKMAKFQPGTVQRWLKHWEAGGSLKALNKMRK